MIRAILLINLGFVAWRLWAAGYDLDLREYFSRVRKDLLLRRAIKQLFVP